MLNLSKSRIRILTIGTGLSLVVTGVCLLYFIMNEFLATYIDYESSSFALKITELLVDKSLFLTDQGTSITIGEGAAVIYGLVFLFIVAWTVISISLSLIKVGCQLLSPDVKSDIEQIKNNVKALKTKGIDLASEQ